MKEKAEIIQQVELLNQIKIELTAQVTSLTSELEKERSKVHALQNSSLKSKVKHICITNINFNTYEFAHI